MPKHEDCDHDWRPNRVRGPNQYDCRTCGIRGSHAGKPTRFASDRKVAPVHCSGYSKAKCDEYAKHATGIISKPRGYCDRCHDLAVGLVGKISEGDRKRQSRRRARRRRAKKAAAPVVSGMHVYRVEVAVYVMATDEGDAMAAAAEHVPAGTAWHASRPISVHHVPPGALDTVPLGDPTGTTVTKHLLGRVA